MTIPENIWKSTNVVVALVVLILGLYVLGLSLAFGLWLLIVVAVGLVVYFVGERIIRRGKGVRRP